MALLSAYTPPKDSEELDKRKELASVLKQFARGEVKVDPEQMAKSGAEMGVSRGQLSGLYKKYREDFKANPPEGMGELPTPMTLGGTPMGPLKPTGLGGDAKKGSVFDQQEQASLAKSTARGAFGGDNWRGQSSETAISTPLLDKYDALQAAPFGSTSTLNQRRSLESEGGKAMRMARMLTRKGYDRAAEQMALAGAQAKMGEPAVRTQAYREQQSALESKTQEEEQKALEEQKRALESQRRLIEARNKTAIKEMNSPEGLSSRIASLF